MLSMKKKMFHWFLPILLCVMLLAGAVMPAVLAVTHAEGGDEFLEPPGLAVGLAGTSLDSPPEITLWDDAKRRTVVNAVYLPPELSFDSTNNTVGNPIELTFTDDEEWRNAVNEVSVNDSALASEDYTLEAGKLTIDASVFTAPGEYTIVVKATGYEDATVLQTLTAGLPWIVSITEVDNVKVPNGTTKTDAIAALAFATTIMDSDGETHNVSLIWTIEDYDSNTAGFYTATGTFKLPEGVEQSDPPLDLEVIATVYVVSQKTDFEVKDGILLKYAGEGGDVVIPGDLGITTIGTVFSGLYNLTSVVIPEGVTTIKSMAFEECSNLVFVVIPESVNEIGAQAFAECHKLTQINIPESVTSIEKETFYRCYALASITLPSGIISLGEGAFQQCSSLSEINIPDAVTSIGKNAFRSCSALTEIVIPANVTSIADSAFPNCKDLVSVTILSRDTTFGNDVFDNSPNVIIYGCSGSTAETYANENDISFVDIGHKPHIVSITPVADVEVPNGTAKEGAIAALGSVTTIMDSHHIEHTVFLTWTIAGYDGNTAGNYTATGTFELPEGVEQSDPPTDLKVVISVTVRSKGSGSVPVTRVSISEGGQMLAVGRTIQLTAIVMPEDATNKVVTWSSSNETVATVSETGLVTAVAEGEAQITVATNDGGHTASITVIVVKPDLTIIGDGVSNPIGFTLDELLERKGTDDWIGPRVYSTINTWPTKKWYASEGVKLSALLEEAGIKSDAQLITVKSTDGFTAIFTKKQLLEDTRYFYPRLKENHEYFGYIPGSPKGAEPVEAIIALRSVEDSNNTGSMSSQNCPLLVLGQRWVTEQTNHTFVKYVGTIEVSATVSPKWASPEATPAGGEVPVGTEVKLSNEFNDADKIYYTTDGSDPTLESPIYNWIASRWWGSRQDVLDEINKPIVITEDTTIKAVTIGNGRGDSDIATFTYKVPKKTSESSEEIDPIVGGPVSLDDEAVIEIPPGALTGTEKVKVKIERVGTPPAAPSGFKLLSDVFEFIIDDKKSYNFNKKVTITLSFNPEAVGEGETPSIHRYDEELGQWINLGGEISDKDNTISVEVDHFSKFAVMAALPSSVTATIKPGEGGTVSLGDEAAIEIPAGALSGNKGVEVKIERVESPPAAPIGFRLLGDAFEFSIDGKKSYNFAKDVIITLSLDHEAFGEGEIPSIHCFDEELGQWENLGGEVSGSTISVEVDHFTKFAVMVELPSSVTALIEPSEGGTVNLGNEVSIEIPPGALTGSEAVEVKIERVKSPPVAPSGFKLLGDVFEITIDGKKSYRFAEEVTIKLGFDPKTATDVEAKPCIHYYDEQLRLWVNLGGEISGHNVTVQVDHFTKIALIGKIKLSLTDIAGHWAESNIKKLVSLGAISGYPDGTFRPNNNITRAEFVTVLVKAFQIEGQGGKVFVDTALHWARESIAVAAASGIAGGYDGDTFRPDDLITREQMAAMIVRAAKLTPLGEELAYTDSESVSGWAVEAVAAAIKSGIMKGYPDNTFRPRGNATRAEAVTAIMNALPENVKPSN